ncbi:hypothetical protein Tco_0729284 [Tanacetum coccineum]|uniref:Reverse transcriptase domain-containing protein n=1 Tax=Tanacetum coccineum TaxID=301880 RepID=A0ABQ4YS01_9ASTR
MTVNTNFLNSLQLEWNKYVTNVRLTNKLSDNHYDVLFDHLQQYEAPANASRAKRVAKTHDHLALVANTFASSSFSRSPPAYYVTHPASVISYNDDYREEEICDDQEDSLTMSHPKISEYNGSRGLSLLTGLMKEGTLTPLFWSDGFLQDDCRGRRTVHALVEEKGKAKDEYYGKLIFDLGNKVRSSVDQGTATMEKLVEKLGNAEDKAECKKLKKELEEARIMPPKSVHMTQAAIHRMIKENVDADIAAELARHANVRNDARGSRPVKGQDATPTARECTFAGFMKCNPIAFLGTEGAIELLRWFEKTESIFGISDCVEGKKIRFAAATL